MKMQQVRYFLSICKELNFTRAATVCGVSQPTISNAIQDLEEKLGGPLFDRTPSVALTALGRSIKPHFEAIWRAVNKVHRIARGRIT